MQYLLKNEKKNKKNDLSIKKNIQKIKDAYH